MMKIITVELAAARPDVVQSDEVAKVIATVRCWLRCDADLP
jgi:hypothetical protein